MASRRHSQSQSPLASIKEIRVEGLFGKYDYQIRPTTHTGENERRLILLYGNNGAGKTTLLKLIFALLSHDTGRGEKTYIAKTPFKNFNITFENGTTIQAQREPKQLVGSYSVSILAPKREEKTFHLNFESGLIQKSQASVKQLFKTLEKLQLSLYFLPDDRNVQTSLTQTAWRAFEHLKHFPKLVRPEDDDDESTEKYPIETHHLDVEPVLDAVSNWFRDHAIQGSSAGDENATTIYLDVAERLASRKANSSEPLEFEKNFNKRLNALIERIQEFSGLGLFNPLPIGKFLSTLEGAPPDRRRLILTLLEPYFQGIEARLTALAEIRDITFRYIDTLNRFLPEKKVEYSLQNGLAIKFMNQIVPPQALSSGEKQLFLLLSSVILARDSQSIFLIDEPELSLNVKWQRRLIDGLLACSAGSTTQFILASHSLELISQYRDCATLLSSAAESDA